MRKLAYALVVQYTPAILSLLFFLNLAPQALAYPSFSNVKANQPSVQKYAKFELEINLTADYQNPFRPEVTSETFRDDSQTSTGTGIILDALVTTPDGTILTVPGFWDVDYTNFLDQGQDIFSVASGGHWHIRFTPRKAGTYRYFLRVTDRTGTTCYPASCAPSTSTVFVASDTPDPAWPHGLLQKSAANPGFLEYEDGTPFTQFGTKLEVKEAPEWLPKLKANGGNFLRHWITDGSSSSVFRNTFNPWSTDDKYDAVNNPIITRGYSSVSHAGKRGFEGKFYTTQSSDTLFTEQGNVGSRGGTCYIAGGWVKLGSDFSGSFLLRMRENGGRVIDSAVRTSPTDWSKVEAGPFKTSSLNRSLAIMLLGKAGTKGTMWLDDAYLYETTEDAAGNCTSTIKYSPDQVNQLFDGDFELGNSMGNPSKLFMTNLARFEYLVNKARENSIVIQTTIFNMRLWGGKNEHSNWAPFLGYDAGYSFWTDEKSRRHAQYALRYLIARYGYAPNLGLWELVNEMCPNYDTTRIDWIHTMAAYLHDHDPYPRLVTNSYWFSPGDPRFEHDPSIDVNSIHYYINDETHDSTHPDEYRWAIRVLAWANNNPKNLDYEGDIFKHTFLSGEFGLLNGSGTTSHWISPTGTDCAIGSASCDRDGIFYHNGVWAMLMTTGYRISVANFQKEAMQAWGYERHYAAPAAFAQYVPFRKAISDLLATQRDATDSSMTDLMTPTIVGTSNAEIRVLGRKSGNNAFLWAQNRNNTWSNRIRYGNSIIDQSGTITISGFTAGNYRVRYVDTISGSVIQNVIKSADTSGKIALTINLGTSFSTANKPDVAIAITPEGDIKAPAAPKNLRRG